VIAQLDYFSFDTLYDFILVFLSLSVLQNVLDNIIAKLILSQIVNVINDAFDDWGCISFIAILEHTLDHSTTIGVNT
jgi:hypothetical protein